MKNVTAVVLCYNESANIEHCLKSVHGECDIFVVDSGSTDDTVDICKRYTNNIFVHPYMSHANQWQWALDNLPLETEWVLALDADFVVTKELLLSLDEKIPRFDNTVNGIYVRHRYVFGGAEIRFGGTKKYWLRVVRKSCASVDTSDLVDFRFLVKDQTINLDESVVEYNRYDDDISVWLRKQDKFSIRLAVEEELRRRKQLDWKEPPTFFGNSDQRFMWLRDRWLNLPLYLRPFMYFLYRYVISLGFFDGKAGFLYHFLQGWWLRLVVDWKTSEIRKLELSTSELENLKVSMLETSAGSVGEILKRQSK
jgi:glycosyltransferase involved in cell wall biosynthesis